MKLFSLLWSQANLLSSDKEAIGVMKFRPVCWIKANCNMGLPCCSPHVFNLLHHCGNQKSISQVVTAEFSHLCAILEHRGTSLPETKLFVWRYSPLLNECVSLPALHHELDVCARLCCHVQSFGFAAASLLGFGPLLGAPQCHVVGGLNPPITPCPGTGEVHTRPASICSLLQAAFALMC